VALVNHLAVTRGVMRFTASGRFPSHLTVMRRTLLRLATSALLFTNAGCALDPDFEANRTDLAILSGHLGILRRLDMEVSGYVWSPQDEVLFHVRADWVTPVELQQRAPHMADSVDRVVDLAATCLAAGWLEDGTFLCQRWSTADDVGGWLTWGRTGVGEAMKRGLDVERIDKDDSWFWWRSRLDVLDSGRREQPPPKVTHEYGAWRRHFEQSKDVPAPDGHHAYRVESWGFGPHALDIVTSVVISELKHPGARASVLTFAGYHTVEALQPTWRTSSEIEVRGPCRRSYTISTDSPVRATCVEADAGK